MKILFSVFLFVSLAGCAHLDFDCEEVPSIECYPSKTVNRCGDKTVTFQHRTLKPEESPCRNVQAKDKVVQ